MENTNKTMQQWHEGIIKEAELQGKDDGVANIPTQQSNQLSPYEKQLRSKYQTKINILGGDRENELAACSKEKIDNLKKQRDKITQEKIEAELETVVKREQEELDQEEVIQIEKVKEISGNAKLKGARLQKEAAAKEFKAICTKLERSSSDKNEVPSDKWYKWILAAIGLSELAVNYQIFQIFRENLILTIIMSACLVALALAAHMTGVDMKQWKDSNNKLASGLMMFGINTGIIILLGYIAYMRADDPKIPEYSVWIFGSLSFVLYAIGVYMAFGHVDSSKSFYRAFVNNDRAIEVYNDILESQNKKRKESEKLYAEKVEGIKRKWELKKKSVTDGVEGKDAEIAACVTTHNEIIAKYMKLDEEWNSNFHSAVQQYRSHNLLERVADAPDIWEKEVESLKLNEIEYEKL